MHAVGAARQLLAGMAIAGVVVAGCGRPPSPPALSTPAGILDPDSPYRTTQEEFLLRTKACVEEKGFPVELDLRQAGFKFSLGDDSRAAASRDALRTCIESIDPARLLPPPKLTETQLTAWYEYRVRQAACVRESGLSLPDPPPLQVFIDTNGEWDPYGVLVGAGNPAPRDVEVTCEAVESRPAFLGW